jgi:hypothetical protein
MTEEKKIRENKMCNDEMSIDECQMAILRHSIDETEKLQKGKLANSDDVQKMIQILENFLRKKKCICYGGTAINNILPEEAQFYDRSVEIPDYDFFSLHAATDAKELADIYYRAGFTETEAKSGVHKGTYKVFVNYIPMADITALHPNIFRSIQKDSIKIEGILYAPPNYLRMGMFLELSRPAGDVSRWEKVFKRLTLLNKYHPLKTPYNCRALDNSKESSDSKEEKEEKIFFTLREAFISENGVFLGGFAASLYSKFVKEHPPIDKNHPPTFDVIVEEPEKCASILKEKLVAIGIRKVKIIKHANLEDVIPEHIQVIVENKTVAFLFKPIACYNYNEIEIGSHMIKVATIDTMLSFYLAFAYSGEPYFDVERILCMAQFLFDIEEENRLNHRGLLKRFSANCYGEQATLASMRAEKSDKFKELVAKGVKKGSAEWNEWFFKYSPDEKKKEGRGRERFHPKRRRTYRKKGFSFFGRKSQRNRFF